MDRGKRIWIGTFLLWMALSTPLSYGIERGLLETLGLEELSGNKEAPAFTLLNPDGMRISLNDYKGKVVILHFWATWCKPCKEEFPAFERLHQRFRNDVIFLAISINVNATQGEITDFARKLGASFPVYLAREGKITNKYWIWGVPVTYFIDKKGWIVGRAIGPRDWTSDNVKAIIDALTEER